MRQNNIAAMMAQGAAANALVAYSIVLVLLLYKPGEGDRFELLVVLPIYILMTAFPGAATSACLWLAESLRGRPFGFAKRAIIGITLPAILSVLMSLHLGFRLNPMVLLTLAMPLLILVVPAMLMSGSPLNPVRSIVLGLEPAARLWDFDRRLSLPFAALLRFASVVGLLETMIYLASLPPSALRDWRLNGGGFLEGIAAVVYFGITALVSFGLPRNPVVIVAALSTNAPLAAWAAQPHRYVTADSTFFAVLIWVLIVLWILFVMGRLLRIEKDRAGPFRLFPVTMFEIRIRHALNHW